jgi:FkbM family methyltransferase
MLISEGEVLQILKKYNININGVLHIGAHECEELTFYKKFVDSDNVIWIDGNKIKVNQSLQRGIKNVYYAVVSDTDDSEVEFHITNNGQSSSILDFGSHSHHHPHVHFIETQKHKTTTIDTFYERNNLDMSKYDFWNFDIQGAELMAIKGANKAIQFAKVLYLEVNSEEVYKGCALIGELDDYLAKHGFKRVLTKMTQYGWGDAVYVKIE